MVDLSRLFDLVCHMNERDTRGTDYALNDSISLNKDQQEALLRKSVQSFIHTAGSVVKDDNDRKVIQAFSGSGDLPQLTKDVFNVTNTVVNYDTLWQSAYKGIKLRKGQLSWEIADVASGITFELIPEGGKAKFYGVSGNKQSVDIAKYAAGIGVTWEIIQGRKLYMFIDMMEQVRSKLFTLWGNIHYGLLATAGLANPIAYQGVATDPVIDRDIATMNVGYTTIGDAVKDKGYGDAANTTMYLYVSPLMKPRINQAVRVTQADIVGGRIAGGIGSAASQTLEFNVVPRYTYNSNVPTNKGLLVLPQNKIQNAVYMQEMSVSERDIETLNEMRSYWTAFGAVVGDTDQVAELAFA